MIKILIILILIILNCNYIFSQETGIQLNVQTNQKFYEEYDEVIFDFKLNKKLYIYIFSLYDQELNLIFPNEIESQNRKKGSFQIPDADAEYHFTALNSKTTEQIIVIASYKKIHKLHHSKFYRIPVAQKIKNNQMSTALLNKITSSLNIHDWTTTMLSVQVK